MTEVPAFRQLTSELRADILSAKALPALSAGFTSGLSVLVAQIAFASFIFSGPLAPWSSQGVGLVLFGNFAACLIVGFASGYRGAIAGLSPALVLAMASVASTTEAEGRGLFVTAAAALIIGATATGLCCLMIGRFRLANLVRFIPYPVAGGFVAGIGGAVCLGAISVMGAELHWREIPANLEPSVLVKWAPGVVFGAALYFSVKRWSHPLILPVSVGLAIGACHLVLGLLGMSGDEARAENVLLASTVDGRLWPALFPGDLAYVEWSAIAGRIPEMLTLMLIAFVCVIMNVAGLEIAVNRELDWDREFRATGVASTVAGLGGGTVATLIVPASLRSQLFGAATRLTGAVAAAVIGVALFFGDSMLELVPTALVGGILIVAGLGMLDEGLLRSRRRLPRSEYGIVLLIFLVIVFFGLLEGVAAGMLATLVFFAVRLSRVGPIESRFTVREHRSNRVRPAPDRAILLADGERARGWRLQGYIFFGSVVPLADELRQSLAGSTPPACLMLDFDAVPGFDYSAASVLSRFVQTAEAAGVPLVLSGLSETLRTGLERNLPPEAFDALLIEPDADRGIERCEDFVIAAWKADAASTRTQRAALLEHAADDLERQLERQIHFESLTERLESWLTPRRYAAEEPIVGPDTPRRGLQLLLSGRASAYDSAGARVRQVSPGDAVWSAGGPDGTTASVVADEPCQTAALAPESLDRLERHDAPLALELYRYLLAGHFGAEPEPGEPTEPRQGGGEPSSARRKGAAGAHSTDRRCAETGGIS